MSKSSELEKLEPEKLDLASLDIATEKQAELLRLFPEVRTEGGKIDFDRLRLALGETVDVGKERYGMNWPGKADCFKAIQRPSLGTLLPVREESVNFDETENLIIEGDNLEVLKLLQKSYQGKVKMIYIDPPYNTGNDFIYPDNYSESLQTYLEYTGQVDNEGRKFSNNTETDGRFHSKWLNMMYPRLYLARNLLREDGAIFITIDDVELSNLKKLCDEIFGEENFIAQIEWQKRYTRSNNTDGFTSVIDHVLMFGKSDNAMPQLMDRGEDADARYENPDDDPRGPWKAIPFTNPLSPEERPNLAYSITNPITGERGTPKRKAWRSSEEVFNRHVRENRVWWGKNGSSKVPSIKRFLSEVRQGMTPINLWSHEFAGHTDQANAEIKNLFDDKVFDTPKPLLLIQRMLELSTSSVGSDLVLDFFAGSGTTAHAVLNQNLKDGGNRRFILVQMPEFISPELPASKAGFSDIAEITIERIRRAGKQIIDQNKIFAGDLGFRVLKLATSNFNVWSAATESTTPDSLAQQLALHIDHIQKGRTSEDLLYEILLKSGFPPTTPIETLTVEGKTVYSVTGYGMLICLDKQLTHEAIKAIAERKPSNVVCLDEGFAGNDQLKTNAVLIMKSKGVTKFQTI
jgi:adenine-specific DNA-methyltransferase